MRCKKIFFVVLTAVFGLARCSLKFSETEINMLVNETKTIELYVKNESDLLIKIAVLHGGVLEISPKVIKIEPELYPMDETHFVMIRSIAAGDDQIFTETTKGLDDVFLTVQVRNSELVEVISAVIGWGYFLAWSVALYPQIYQNHKRKSVVGLNFDFLSISTAGFVCYAIFNVGIYCVPLIRDQYAVRFPRSVISVLVNDVFLSVHIMVLFLYVCLQCFWYERGGQTMSWFGKGFCYWTALILLVAGALSVFDVIEWLDFLYISSYVKLLLTVLKYVPQAVMNYQRKSTSGFCIIMVTLDLTGGSLSLLQMFLNAYNYDKWGSMLENPSKLGLGLLTLIFDVVLMAQHYCLYGGEEIVEKAGEALEMDVLKQKNGLRRV